MKKLLTLLVALLVTTSLLVSCDSSPKTSTEDSSVEEAVTITLTFETDGKAEVPAVSVEVGEVPEMPTAPVVDGYVFAGWYFDKELTNRYFFDYVLEEDTTLYAKFYDTTLGEYIVISNIDQFIAIKDDPTAKYLLACDINARGNTLLPISSFSGELDGNGYKLFNFAMNQRADNVALIVQNSGVIKNFNISDFIYDVKKGEGTGKTYAVIVTDNTGKIQNCHILDGEIKISITTAGGCHIRFGAIVGCNKGEIENCSNNANIEAIACDWYEATAVYGGIVGKNEGKIVKVINKGAINFTSVSERSLIMGAGGVVGWNEGVDAVIENSANIGNINYVDQSNGINRAYSFVGGFVGENGKGVINNCYVDCDLTADATLSRNGANSAIGGFAGRSYEKIYACYSNVNMDVKCNDFPVGGFVGNNIYVSGYQALVSKCFALGSIVVDKELTNVGYFAGANTGDIVTCAYADSLTIKLKTTEEDAESGEVKEILSDLEPTCLIGESMAEAELLSLNYLENTLYFDRMIWLLKEGQLPTLR